MIKMNCPKYFSETQKERLFLATKQCGEYIVRCAKSHAFKSIEGLNDLEAGMICRNENDMHNGYINILLWGIKRKDAEKVVFLNNLWKPNSPLWKCIIGPMFSTETIMMNVDVLEGPCCNLYSRYIIHVPQTYNDMTVIPP